LTEDQGPRSAAEWVTFVVSLLVLGVVVALIGVQHFAGQEPAAPAAEIAGPVREQGGHWYVPVEVTNHGDDTAENVQVLATLTIDGETFEGDQTIDFLSGREVEEVAFAFDEDPADGELVVTVSGYVVP
jgi:uncharacterized protein (TIGR02588 family)